MIPKDGTLIGSWNWRSSASSIDWSHAVFAFGLMVFLTSRLALTLISAFNGSFAAQPDDAYAYIAKTPQMYSCFFQDCPALVDIEAQVSRPTTDPVTNLERLRTHLRYIAHYHPFYSVLLMPFHAAGLSWEQAFNALSVVGAVFMTATLAWFLCAIWGAGGAGVGLFILAFVILRGHGLHTVVPSTLALAIALGMWAAVIERRSWCFATVGLGGVAGLLVHPLGVLYFLIALGLFLWLEPRPWRAREWIFIVAMISLVGLFAAKPWLITSPSVDTSPYPLAEGAERIALWLENLKASPSVMWGLIAALGNPIAVLMLATVGIVMVPKERRRALLGFTLLLAAVLAVSLFHVLPLFPAETFMRVGVAGVLILAGGLGQAIWLWLRMLGKGLKGIADRKQRDSAISSPLGRFAALVVLGAFAATWTVGQTTWRGTHSIAAQIENSVEKFRPVLVDENQIQRLLEISDAGDDILYEDEVTLSAYLINGAERRGAVLYPQVVGTELERAWLNENQQLRFLAFRKPFYKYPPVLTARTWIEVKTVFGAPREKVGVYFDNPAGQATVEVEVISTASSAADSTIIQLAARQSGWVSLRLALNEETERLRFSVREPGAKVFMKGFRMDAGSPLRWAWANGVSLRWSIANGRIFESDLIVPSIYAPNCGARVVDDSGGVVLAELACRGWAKSRKTGRLSR